jgi:hypothetical protein
MIGRICHRNEEVSLEVLLRDDIAKAASRRLLGFLAPEIDDGWLWQRSFVAPEFFIGHDFRDFIWVERFPDRHDEQHGWMYSSKSDAGCLEIIELVPDTIIH